jgi:hypothetical protein
VTCISFLGQVPFLPAPYRAACSPHAQAHKCSIPASLPRERGQQNQAFRVHSGTSSPKQPPIACLAAQLLWWEGRRTYGDTVSQQPRGLCGQPSRFTSQSLEFKNCRPLSLAGPPPTTPEQVADALRQSLRGPAGSLQIAIATVHASKYLQQPLPSPLSYDQAVPHPSTTSHKPQTAPPPAIAAAAAAATASHWCSGIAPCCRRCCCAATPSCRRRCRAQLGAPGTAPHR